VRVRERPVHDSSIVAADRETFVGEHREAATNAEADSRPLCRPLTLKRANESATERILLVSLAS